MSGPINVLFVEAPPLPYGSSRSLLSLMTNFDRSLVRPVLACNRENDLLSWAESAGITAFPLSLPGLPQESKSIVSHAQRTSKGGDHLMSPSLSERLLLPARFIRDALEFRTVRGELSKIVDENHIHILHLNNQVSTNRFAYSLGSKAKIVQHVRDAPLSRSLHTSRLSRRANRIIAISDYVGTDAAMAYSREITDVIANPVDKNFTFSSKSRKEWRDAWSVPDDVLLFGQAGRFVDWKGTDTAIEAYTQLCSNSDFQKSTRLVLVGSSADQSEYFERCKRMADQLPSGQVRIEPFSKDAAGLFSAFDVTLHPIRKPEGFGRVIVESMACRSVPLARDLGAIGEIITHQVDGLIFKNTEDLRKTMREIHQSPASLRKLSDRGFETAKSYSAEGIAHKMENIYREVVSA